MAAITYTFAPLSDVVLFDVDIPRHMKPIHAYYMKRLNIKGWRIHPADIAKEFKCSIKTACRALWWFRDHGYGAKANDGRWIIYPSPQTTVNNASEPTEAWTKMSILEPALMDKNVQLIEKEAFKEKETTTPEPIKQPDTVIPVVVSLEEEKPVELKYPEQLTLKQKADIKHHIKKAPIEHRQAILTTLAHYLAKGTIYNPIGWIRSQAEGAAKTGNYEPVGAATATKPDTKHYSRLRSD
jgi:hypothetical protein